MNFAKARRTARSERALTAATVVADLKEKKRKFDIKGSPRAKFVAHSIRKPFGPKGVTVLAFSHPTKKASKGRRGLIIT